MSKIVHAIHCCNIGGAEIFVKNLVISMIKQNPSNEYEIWAIYNSNDLYNGDAEAISYEKQYINELVSNGIKVNIVSKERGILGRFKMMRTIKKLYNNFQPDIINCHLETVTFHIASSLFFQPVSIYETIHTNAINKKFIHKYFLNFKIKKYIAISKSIKKIIENTLNCSSQKIRLIYNGIDVSKFDVEKEILDKKDVNIIAIGRLIDVKNHKLLIDAYKNMIDIYFEDNNTPKLKIYGDGVLKKELQEYINKLNLKRCDLIGSTGNVPEVLRDNDIYVLPSNIEGFSISLLEAKTSGISIICTDVGGNSEIIKDNITGYIIEKNDIQSLTNYLYELSISPKKRKKFYNNCKKEKDFFNIELCAMNYLDLYTEGKKR